MPSLSNIQPTTELEAVNELLAAGGEAPISNLATSPRNDVRMAADILRSTAREVLKEGWRFNTEFGLELAPAGTLVWTDTSGTSTTLNVFTPPSGLASWELPYSAAQADLDLVIRPSKKYTDANGVLTKVFYDRALNRDGLDSAAFESLYINATWFFDFEDLPQSARDYITQLSIRRFVERVIGSEALSQFTTDDLVRARRALIREQGMVDKPNLFNNPGAAELFGRRQGRFGRTPDDRSSPTFT